MSVKTTKRCTRCGKEKDVSEFSRDSRRSSGLRSSCKACDAEQWSRYSRANRERLTRAGRRYYWDNREKELERRKHDREKRLRTYRKREKLAKRKARREKLNIVRARARRYYAENSLLIRLRNRLYRAFRAYSETGKQQRSDEYGVDYQAIIDHLGKPPDDGQEWHIDHIRPLSSFDFDDPEQVREAFSPENHQWLEAFENRSKGDTYEP